jgi:hypothetical protein
MNSPTDKSRWFMTPQTINAYYHPSLNEIVFPAAILQVPIPLSPLIPSLRSNLRMHIHLYINMRILYVGAYVYTIYKYIYTYIEIRLLFSIPMRMMLLILDPWVL